MSFSELNSRGKEAELTRLVLKYLQELGGEANRQEIREKIVDSDEEIADFESIVKVSKKKKNEYRPFYWLFNFAFRNLKIAGFADYTRANPVVRLTDKGMQADIGSIDADKDILVICDKYWEDRKAEGKSQKPQEDDEPKEEDLLEDYNEEFKDRLLNAIKRMTPAKFEAFSRLLLSKMGIVFTEKGIQISNDGGIDGYGYCCTDDYRTSRVVIQCKRWQNSVGAPEIRDFLGAMNTYQADYGVFITNSRYTPAARETARAGTPVTLVDGDDLVRLVQKYMLHIIPVQTYILDPFYDEE